MFTRLWRAAPYVNPPANPPISNISYGGVFRLKSTLYNSQAKRRNQSLKQGIFVSRIEVLSVKGEVWLRLTGALALLILPGAWNVRGVCRKYFSGAS